MFFPQRWSCHAFSYACAIGARKRDSDAVGPRPAATLDQKSRTGRVRDVWTLGQAVYAANALAAALSERSK